MGTTNIDLGGGLGPRIRTIASAGSILVTDEIILFDSTSGAFAAALPSVATPRKYLMFDTGGVCGTNPVTLTRNGSETIKGLAADYLLQGNRGAWIVVADGTNWQVMS